MTGLRGVKVLCVDDDAQLLAGLGRTLGRHFDLHTETSPHKALERLRAEPGFAVVVSDMQMPGMLGTQFLKEARALRPNTVRMLLTGHADLSTALSAVNDGFVFRVLTKPCPSLSLVTMVNEAVEQHRALTADREKLDAVSSQLLQSERLATLGTLACGVGHELNNLSAVFSGIVSALEEAVAAGQPPLAQDVADLGQVARHLRAHGRQLLDLGRPSHAAAEPVDLCEVVTRTMGMLQTAGKTRRLAVDLRWPAGSEAVVLARRTQLEQVLVNLVINAVDAMGEVPGRAHRLTIELQVHDGFAHCTVIDTGSGMAPEVQARIFEAFFTTKSADRGTGLGLPVVRQIVEGHGGSMAVVSRVGEGTAITFKLPLHQEQGP